MAATPQTFLDPVERFALKVEPNRSPSHNEARLRNCQEMVTLE